MGGAADRVRDEYEATIAFYEIYKDSVIDLLSDQRSRVNIVEEGGDVTLPNLTWRVARSESDAYHILFQGDANRHFERHSLNPETSRGHVFFVLRLLHRPTGREANLSFVDLAASINVRNKATASITRSLESLRTVVAGLQSGQCPPNSAWDASPLTQLLKPALLQPKEPVNVVALFPMRFTEQSRREIRSWLKFAQSIREGVMGIGAVPEVTAEEEVVLNNGRAAPDIMQEAVCPPEVVAYPDPNQRPMVVESPLMVASSLTSGVVQDVKSIESPDLECTRPDGVNAVAAPVAEVVSYDMPLQLDSDRVPQGSNNSNGVKAAKVAVPCLPLSNLGSTRNGVDRGIPVVIAPPQASVTQYSKIQAESTQSTSPSQAARVGASSVPVPVPPKTASAQGTPNPTPAYPASQVHGVTPPVPGRTSGRVVQETWQASPALCARSPSAATRSTTPIRFVARPLGSGYPASPQQSVSPMRSVPHRNIEVRASSPVPSPAAMTMDRKPRVNAYAHTGASPQPATPSGGATPGIPSGLPVPATSTATRAISPQPQSLQGMPRTASAASPTPQRLMQLSGSHRSTTPMRQELAARTCTPPAKVSYANTRFMSPTPNPRPTAEPSRVSQQSQWQFGAPPPVPAQQQHATFMYR